MRTLDLLAQWRRTLLIVAAAVVAACALSTAVPERAQATIVPITPTVQSSFEGWAQVWGTTTMCPISINLGPCQYAGRDAYRWTGYSWARTTLAHNTMVYAYPYGSGWHWVWTERTGWLAVRTAYVHTLPCSDGTYRCFIG